MGKRKGTPKTGGREKGTPNKSSLYIRNELASAKINLVDAFLAEVKKLEKPADRLSEMRWLFKYVVPELKPVESAEDKEDEAQKPAAPAAPPAPSAAQLSDEELERIAKGPA